MMDFEDLAPRYKNVPMRVIVHRRRHLDIPVIYALWVCEFKILHKDE